MENRGIMKLVVLSGIMSMITSCEESSREKSSNDIEKITAIQERVNISKKKTEKIVDTEIVKQREALYKDLDKLFSSDKNKKLINSFYETEIDANHALGQYIMELYNFLWDSEKKYEKLNIKLDATISDGDKLRILIKKELHALGIEFFMQRPINNAGKYYPRIKIFRHEPAEKAKYDLSPNPAIRNLFESNFVTPNVNIIKEWFVKPYNSINFAMHSYDNGISNIYLNIDVYENGFNNFDSDFLDEFFDKNPKQKELFMNVFNFRNEFGHAEFKNLNLKNIEYDINFLGSKSSTHAMQIEEAWSDVSSLLAMGENPYNLGAAILEFISEENRSVPEYKFSTDIIISLCYNAGLISLKDKYTIDKTELLVDIENMNIQRMNWVRETYLNGMLDIIKQAKIQSNAVE